MVILFLFLTFISIIVILADHKNKANRWMSATALFSGFSGLGVVLEENIFPLVENTPFYNLTNGITQVLYTISYQVTPCCFLFYCIITTKFAYGVWIKWEKYCIFIFCTPIYIMYLIFPVFPLYQPDFKILSAWVVPYVIFSNALLFRAYFIEKNLVIKQQKLLTIIICTPATLFSLMTCYVVRGFNIQSAWRYNTFIIIMQFISFIIFARRYGVMGVKLKLEKYNIDNTMRAMTSGTAMLNHSIKNEVMKISMGLENIKRSLVKSNKNIEESMEVITDSTEHIIALVTKIHEQVREIILNEESNDLVEIIEYSLNTVNPFLSKKNISIKRMYMRLKLMIVCDKFHIQEALINVFKNSIEAMESNGELSIEIIEEKKRIILCVKDNGKGIPRESLPYVIEPFYSTKKLNMNFGLGLSYCYNVMMKHGGTLEITSEENIGTAVYLIFPLKRDCTIHSGTEERGISA